MHSTTHNSLRTQNSELRTPAWYAIYTSPRAEKKANAELLKNGIDTYLPLQRNLRQWSDRKKWVEEPLFRSYLFVNIDQGRYFDVLNTAGVVRYVTFEGKAVPVPQKQIDAIRYYLEDETAPQSDGPGEIGAHEPGTPVEMVRGPLRGLRGELVESQGRQTVRIQIEALGQFLHLTISASHLRKL